jgi:hypothetical protein
VPSSKSAKRSTKFVLKATGTVAIYDDRDRDLLDNLEHTADRASHVDPLKKPRLRDWLNPYYWNWTYAQNTAFKRYGDGYWAIYWKGLFAAWHPVFQDEAGQPFRTKEEAEMFEVAMLERDYFGVRRVGPLFIESLKREHRSVPSGDTASQEGSPTNLTPVSQADDSAGD